ncbi:unnamed protein product [Urochloa humidicola]
MWRSSLFSRYRAERAELTKIISLIYVVDDLFDLVGTQEELSLFAKAIKMWNTEASDSLPSCMRSCYKALYTITNEIADMAEKENGMNPVNHLRKAWAELFEGFMVESRWLAAGQDDAQEGLDGSYRDFYLLENPSYTPSDAEAHMRRLISREWKELNRECFSRMTFSSTFTLACLNAARMVSVMTTRGCCCFVKFGES